MIVIQDKQTKELYADFLNEGNYGPQLEIRTFGTVPMADNYIEESASDPDRYQVLDIDCNDKHIRWPIAVWGFFDEME